MDEKAKTDIVYITIKKEELEPYEEGIIQERNQDTNCGILEPKREIETLQNVKHEVVDDYDEKPTIEYGIISKDEIPEEKPFPYGLSPDIPMVEQPLVTRLMQNTKGKSVRCRYCSKLFARKVAMLEHILQHEGRTKLSAFSKDLEGVALVEDETQDIDQRKHHPKPKPSNSTAQQHLSSPEPMAYPHPCALCDRRYEYRWQLNKHALVHSTQRPHVCEHCCKGYKSKCALRRHLLVKHGEKPYACEYCDERFTNKLHAVRHELTHVEKKPYVCGCGTAFARQLPLVAHLRNHCDTGKTVPEGHRPTEATDKPFVCGMCGKAYGKSQYLRMHCLTHLEGKLACTFCDLQFKSKSGLMKHTTNVHL